MQKINVTIWNEYIDEKKYEHIKAIYPEGIHIAIASFFLQDKRFAVTTATLDMPDAGLPDDLLEKTDVLLWWGHVAHQQVPADRIMKICRRVLDGMGFIALHSGMFSLPFQNLIGPRMNLHYREVGEHERIWVVNPAHPICEGLDSYIEIEHSEMYGEPTGLADPDQLIMISWYAGGEIMRSGGCYFRGRGRIFYLASGHEEYPIYDHPQIQQVLRNAAAWAYNPGKSTYITGEAVPLEPLDPAKLLKYEKK